MRPTTTNKKHSTTKKNVQATKKKSRAARALPRVVDRLFLLSLADSIHNPKTKTFLRLCNGRLQNGPDPTDASRPMHCGLGELYFAMTGRQPEDDLVNEDQVVEKAVEMAGFKQRKREAVAEATLAVTKVTKEVIKLPLPGHVVDDLVTEMENSVDAVSDECDTKEDEFREAIADIPDRNDDGLEADECTVNGYRERSRRVADQLRAAADLLP